MFGRLTTLASAAAIAGAAFAGISTASAQAAPGCPDVHWFGAAGSGQRDGDLSSNAGMGDDIYQSYLDVQQLVTADGRTMTAEAVAYPAIAVPDDDGGVGEWLGFMGSVDTGAAALESQYTAFTQRCPESKVVLAGYSQGAMVVHRNLHAAGTNPNVVAALLIADGDRLPADPTINIGSVSSVPGAGKGVAQDWPILAHAPKPLPPAIGARTISVCELGDAVCDYDPDAEEVSKVATLIHTSYTKSSGGYRWTQPLYQLIGPGPVTPDVPEALPVIPLAAATPMAATAPSE
ncbi:cutinase [Mycolicibacterium acapulense]|uniref:Cutinase n=1 Tax=Mycobacterium lehmannii TaxID=2048550 RepID=A0A124ENB9_9MYCO|nr:cutinase family protein [Mycobacterium lehmannii]KUH94778.1 cutinase [Mycolicibacterium acapulense]KUI06499.1 cutinase [Mycobacterium lehmannii]